MTSSSSFEISLWRGARRLGGLAAREDDLPAAGFAEEPALAGEYIGLTVVRPPRASTSARVRLGPDVHLVLRPGDPSGRTTIPPLRDEYGEATITYEEYDPDEPEDARVLLELSLEVKGSPELVALHERLIQDLSAIHVRLAEDFISRTTHRRAGADAAATILRPEQEVERLERLRASLEGSLARIGKQPSTALVREHRRDRWRAGDAVRTAALAQIARDPGTVIVRGRVRAVRTAPVQRGRLTADIGEHRHIRQALRRLERRARAVADHCERAASLVEVEEARWGGAGRRDPSVFEQRHLPQIRRLRAFAERADSLAEGFGLLLCGYPFVAQAGVPRSRLAPTPTFLNRAGYREAYPALCETESAAGPLVAGDEVRIRYRSLSRLYEYWCFVRVAELLHERFGSPASPLPFELVHEVYRPDLRPGQQLRFDAGRCGEIVVTYEPDFPPIQAAGGSTTGFGASLVRAPLRPDITVALEQPGAPPVILVLDAKSAGTFDREMLWKVSDYRSLVIDAASGWQPVRQVFLLHRDENSGFVCNVPGYLEERQGDETSWIIGAVSFLPDRVEKVRRVLDRFIAIFGRAPAAGTGP